jgi:hypothetical protein
MLQVEFLNRIDTMIGKLMMVWMCSMCVFGFVSLFSGAFRQRTGNGYSVICAAANLHNFCPHTYAADTALLSLVTIVLPLPLAITRSGTLIFMCRTLHHLTCGTGPSHLWSHAFQMLLLN